MSEILVMENTRMKENISGYKEVIDFKEMFFKLIDYFIQNFTFNLLL
jgi:hypothetical protein